MRDIRAVLQRWGDWAAHEENRSAWPPLCATFRGILPGGSSLRPSCCDDDGLIVDRCVSTLHHAGRDVADVLETNRMQVRNLLVAGEEFVNGGLVALGVRLDMDLVLRATGQVENPVFLLSGFGDVSARALVA